MSDEEAFELDDEKNRQNPYTAKGQGQQPKPPASKKLDENTKVKAFKDLIAPASDVEKSFKERTDVLIQGISQVIPSLFEEAVSSVTNPDRSVSASRTIMALKALIDALNKQREADTAENVNVYNSKFQLIFGWFLELIYTTLAAQDIEESQLNAIFNDLGEKLMGWEDKVQSSLKGVRGKALSQVENPFITEFKATLKKQPTDI